MPRVFDENDLNLTNQTPLRLFDFLLLYFIEFFGEKTIVVKHVIYFKFEFVYGLYRPLTPIGVYLQSDLKEREI